MLTNILLGLVVDEFEGAPVQCQKLQENFFLDLL